MDGLGLLFIGKGVYIWSLFLKRWLIRVKLAQFGMLLFAVIKPLNTSHYRGLSLQWREKWFQKSTALNGGVWLHQQYLDEIGQRIWRTKGKNFLFRCFGPWLRTIGLDYPSANTPNKSYSVASVIFTIAKSPIRAYCFLAGRSTSLSTSAESPSVRPTK